MRGGSYYDYRSRFDVGAYPTQPCCASTVGWPCLWLHNGGKPIIFNFDSRASPTQP